MENNWEEKAKDIEFLKYVLPYWQAEDLDDYMYVVHHYDLERVAKKFRNFVSTEILSAKREVLEEVKKHIEAQMEAKQLPEVILDQVLILIKILTNEN
jgi:hypothetical protein